MTPEEGYAEAQRRIRAAADSQHRHLFEIELDLHELGLIEIPPELFGLTQLEFLNLTANKLSRLPDEIGQLASLIGLYIGQNQLTELPASLGGLSKLGQFFANSNKLLAFPAFHCELPLVDLRLFSNEIEVLPAAVGNLSNLALLDIRWNQITELPSALGDLRHLKEFEVSGNPLTSPPPEIVAQGTKAILEFLRNSTHLIDRRTAKMVFVGEPKVGKTTLFRVLNNLPARPDEDETHGMRVETLALPHPSGGEPMHLSTWDFGGQHILHATHQFFLTDGALFVLIWNSREGVEKGRLNYWLDMIAARAPSSPILLVSTGLDQSPPDVNLDPLRAKYRIVGHLAVSCTKGTNIPELLAKITEVASGLRMMSELWPADWVKAADAIRAIGKPHVPPEQITEAMAANGLSSTAQPTLAGWLRELGDIVYYGDGGVLGDLVVLQPEWVAREISFVLESDAVRKRGGILLRSDVNQLWHATPPAVRDLLCRLMDQYDLTYNTEHKDEIGIVVECLARAPTEFRPLWESAAGKAELRMRFQFRSELPPGIPTWFIAREHRFTTHNQWRGGALFKKGDDLCLIETIRESREVSLTVRGTQPAYFFGVMLDGFDQTLNRYPGVEASLDRYIPCPDRNCPGEFGYADLLGKLKRAGPNKKAECGKCDTDFTLAQLLYAIPDTDIAARLHSIEQKIDRGFDEMSRQFTLQLKRAQNERDNDCPGVFNLHPRRGVDVLRTTLEAWLGALRGESAEMELSLYCEFHGEWHPTAHSVYQFKTDAAWLTAVAPYWKKVRAVVKLAPHVKEAVEVTEAFLTMETHRHSELSETMEARYDRDPAWGAARIRVRELLRELDKQRKDPATHWGGLTQVLTPEGEVLWVCPKHKSELFPHPR